MVLESGAHCGSLTTNAPSVSRFSLPVSRSTYQRCVQRNVSSTTSASSRSLRRRLSSALSGSAALNRIFLPSGEMAKLLTPPSCLVAAQASPPSVYMTCTWLPPPSEPASLDVAAAADAREERNARREPSGNHAGAVVLASP